MDYIYSIHSFEFPSGGDPFRRHRHDQFRIREFSGSVGCRIFDFFRNQSVATFQRCYVFGGVSGTGVSLVFLAQGEGDLDGFDGCHGRDGVVVPIDFHDDVRRRSQYHLPLRPSHSGSGEVSFEIILRNERIFSLQLNHDDDDD